MSLLYKARNAVNQHRGLARFQRPLPPAWAREHARWLHAGDRREQMPARWIALWKQPLRLRIPPRSKKAQACDNQRAAVERGSCNRHGCDGGGFGAKNRVARAMLKSIRPAETLAVPSVHPPSGPIASTIPLLVFSGSTHHGIKFDLPIPSARYRRPAGALTHSESLIGVAISAGHWRRDCSDACRAMRCHRSDRFTGCCSQMLIGAARDHRHEPRDAELRAFFDRPLHAVELEYGKKQGDLGHIEPRNSSPSSNSTRPSLNQCNSSAANGRDRWRYRTLANASAQHADQMIRMGAEQGRVISGDFVGNPAAAAS